MRNWWVRSCLAVTTVAATLAATALPAAACGEDDKPAAAAHVTGEPGAVKNVRSVGNLPDAQGAISLAFLPYGHRDVMAVSGQFGLKLYDLTENPAAPKLVGQLNMPGLWETEDTEVDPVRKLVFLSRDPRAFGGNTHTGESGIYVVDVSTPEKPVQLSYVKVPAGHTTSCINDCRYLWTGGPAKADNQPADWGGRPIWVTDVRDPRNPKVSPQPIELARNDGKTDYVHDVQVDKNDVAWVSGRGGVRGYWTDGVHRDPVQGKMRRATAYAPVPYAGGGVAETAAPSKFMHNSFHPANRRDDGAWRGHDLVYATEESFVDGCAGDGVLTISSLEGSYGGEGWKSTPDKPFRLRTVGTWGVAGQEGSDPKSDDCSAHYFDIQDKVLVQSFYAQGTRFLDISDPTTPKQIAYFRPADAASWAPYWHRGHVYVADNKRGIDILKLTAQ
ncbi:LVIVD repeat-containing protein [Amycolatopsis sp. NPDC059021]|uniref:LVIVD repeat-containing protein n=1 Tax=Amycolatopsis sp. NPDC059021 TaxID=3346704 RepID=UPI00367017CD